MHLFVFFRNGKEDKHFSPGERKLIVTCISYDIWIDFVYYSRYEDILIVLIYHVISG